MRTQSFVFGAVALAIAAGSASAAFTNVALPAGAGNEPGVVGIYKGVVGNPAAAGLATADVNTAAGRAAMRRVDDGLDTIFRDGTAAVVFSAVYWGGGTGNPGSANHDFYISRNGVLGSALFSAGPAHGTAPGSTFVPADFPTTDVLRFVAHNTTSGRWANSDPTALNGNGQANTSAAGTTDRMLTFDVTGFDLFKVGNNAVRGAELDLPELELAYKRTFLLFFETGTDGDYQDLVVIAHSFALIPLPSAGAMGLAGLALVATRRRR